MLVGQAIEPVQALDFIEVTQPVQGAIDRVGTIERALARERERESLQPDATILPRTDSSVQGVQAFNPESCHTTRPETGDGHRPPSVEL
ncbi:MAG: hypothetical protein RLZZ221_2855 [Verrucomicrobiota bacterium]